MLQTSPLTQNKEFRRAYYRGKSVTTPFFVLYAFKNRTRQKRLGLTATKKVGKAVQRNRARRVLKESYRLLETRFPAGWDYVLVARTRILTVKTPQVTALLADALKKLFPAV